MRGASAIKQNMGLICRGRMFVLFATIVVLLLLSQHSINETVLSLHQYGFQIEEHKVTSNDTGIENSINKRQNVTARQNPKDLVPIETTAIQSNVDYNLTSTIQSLSFDWDSPPPSWLTDLCPEVVKHFSDFPSFQRLPHPLAPFMTTLFAAQSVCTLKVTKFVVNSIGTQLYLYAGSQLGALLHGQPIPWDDDVDVMMDYRFFDDFFRVCNESGFQVHNQVSLKCTKGPNALKVWLHPDGMVKLTTHFSHFSPFVDLFLVNITDTGLLQEIPPDPKWKKAKNFSIHHFYPSSTYYFGGIYIHGPNVQLAFERYDLNICKTSFYNHRLEVGTRPEYAERAIDCESLKGLLPFVHRHDGEYVVSNGKTSFHTYSPERASNLDKVAISTTIEQRNDWYNLDASSGQNLTDRLDGLNVVEVDNTISKQMSECNRKRHLKIVEFNAERGRWWLEAATSLDVLKEADVIILNEMDIGMARSNQQHTARQMAFLLGMNYAWGLEFVELSIGDEGDRAFAPTRLPNFIGLHGNAILSKCEVEDPTIFRNQVGEYFSDRKIRINANGLEKRLGGRMALFGRIKVQSSLIAVGSVHKLGENGQNFYGKEIQEYIGDNKAVVAGDQNANFCGLIGLKTVKPKGHNGFTWPASCQGFGHVRGDNICTNANEVEPERITKPCIEQYGMKLQLGDHALTSIILDVGHDVNSNDDDEPAANKLDPAAAGVVHYKTTMASGWNNQRQGAMVAWVVAYITGHTLQYKTFSPAFTGVLPDPGGYSHGDLWDTEYLQKYVNVMNISHEQTSDGYEFKFSIETVFHNRSDVSELSKYHSISYDTPWARVLPYIFPWLNPWQDPGKQVFMRLMESFTYTPHIQKVADEVVRRIGGPFIGLHVRAGRLPALRCQDINATTAPATKDRYARGSCTNVTWTNVLEKVFPNNDLPVYIAHDGKRKRGDFGGFQSFDFDIVRALRPAIISAVEQEIMIRAHYFVGSLRSSWSEHVVYKRVYTEQDGEKNYKLWIENGQDPKVPQ